MPLDAGAGSGILDVEGIEEAENLEDFVVGGFQVGCFLPETGDDVLEVEDGDAVGGESCLPVLVGLVLVVKEVAVGDEDFLDTAGRGDDFPDAAVAVLVEELVTEVVVATLVGVVHGDGHASRAELDFDVPNEGRFAPEVDGEKVDGGVEVAVDDVAHGEHVAAVVEPAVDDAFVYVHDFCFNG